MKKAIRHFNKIADLQISYDGDDEFRQGNAYGWKQAKKVLKEAFKFYGEEKVNENNK